MDARQLGDGLPCRVRIQSYARDSAARCDCNLPAGGQQAWGKQSRVEKIHAQVPAKLAAKHLTEFNALGRRIRRSGSNGAETRPKEVLLAIAQTEGPQMISFSDQKDILQQ